MKFFLYIIAFCIFSIFSYAGDLVGQWNLGGMFFKDQVIVKAFSDPKVKGVTCYVTSISKSLTFTDPSNTAISCVKTGKIVVSKDVNLSPEGENIVSEKQSLIWKKMKIRRIYDLKRNTLLYVTYVTKMIDGSFKISMSAISAEP
jgi:CreA protein